MRVEGTLLLMIDVDYWSSGAWWGGGVALYPILCLLELFLAEQIFSPGH